MTITEAKAIREGKQRNIVRIGKTYYISLPKKWLLTNKIIARKIKSLLVLEGADITIVNPCNEIGVIVKPQTSDKLIDIEFETPIIQHKKEV